MTFDRPTRQTANRRGCQLLGALVVSSLLLLNLSGGTPVAAETGAYQDGHPLLAYYYAWWEPEKITAALFTPLQQFPDWVRQIVDDPALMRQHVQEAQSAGIDGFIVNRSSDFTHLLDVVRGSDFRLTLQVDATGDPASETAAFYTHIHDSNLITYHGQPVLFFWYVRAHDAAFWRDLRAQFDPGHSTVWMADGDDFSLLDSDTWDGISPYAIAWSADPRAQLPAWGAKARAAEPSKLYVPPVSPGCDDHLARPATCLRDRAGGAYYQATLDGAAAADPTWAVIVSTFNEWMEATQVEPSTEYGDQYLKMTRAFADVLHASAGEQSVASAQP